MIYLDNNATTRPTDAVAQAVHVATTTLWANPSSVHRAGQEARHALELARRELANLLRVNAKELILTATGTESVDLAVRGVLESRLSSTGVANSNAAALQPVRRPLPNIVTTRIEHSAVRDLVEHLHRQGRIEARWLPLDSRGMADPDALDALIDDHTALVSVQWANNETGVIQPLERLANVCRKRDVPLHCDAVQWIGKMPVEATPTRDQPHDPRAQAAPPLTLRPSAASSLPADLLSFSAHKFHGPRGAGGLWIRRGVPLVPQAIGSQETDRRAGTENLPAIVGAGVAAREAAAWLADPAPRAKLAALRDRFEAGVRQRIPAAAVNGADCPRLWNTSNIAFPGLEAEAMLMLLSEKGLAASAGAACSSGSLDPSPVLLAMGIPPRLAHGSIRFSLSRHTTEDEITRAVEIVAQAAAQLGQSSASAT